MIKNSSLTREIKNVSSSAVHKKKEESIVIHLLCQVCCMPFTSMVELASHEVAHGLELNLKCLSCPMEFVNYTSLIRHTRSARSYKKKNYCPHICKVCGKRFVSSSNGNNLARIHTNNRPYKCSLCEKAYNQASTLNKHMSAHNRVPKPFVCSVCGMAFRSKYYLCQHTLVHSVKRPYLCSQCGKAFKCIYDVQRVALLRDRMSV